MWSIDDDDDSMPVLVFAVTQGVVMLDRDNYDLASVLIVAPLVSFVVLPASAALFVTSVVCLLCQFLLLDDRLRDVTCLAFTSSFLMDIVLLVLAGIGDAVPAALVVTVAAGSMLLFMSWYGAVVRAAVGAPLADMSDDESDDDEEEDDSQPGGGTVLTFEFSSFRERTEEEDGGPNQDFVYIGALSDTPPPPPEQAFDVVGRQRSCAAGRGPGE